MIKNLDLKNLLIYSHWLLVLWKMVCIFVSFDNAFKTTLKRETFNFYLKEFISFLKLKDKPVFQYFHRIMEESWKCFNTTLLLTVMAVVCFVFFPMLDSKSNYIPGADDYVYDNQKEKNLVVTQTSRWS